ncbi:MAG: dTDP-4-amino-4,6-dideoxygalactose transaminase [Planctomycetota bacterium]|nr:dTDP-4-amino-4,6-dideoxygalactose transaminase [Planctomycetota bacterium]MDW8373215.1 dTDP-4-amino-4,6-dideoxygalactose transaminase [Planctomycetota bacterium]
MSIPHGRNPPAAVPFNRHWNAPGEAEAVAEALRSGHLCGDGPFTRRCQERLAALLDGTPTLLTPSGTAALELAALLLGERPGSVVVPSFTFPSTASAFALRGLTLRFADAEPATACVSAQTIAAAAAPDTVGVCLVHYAGIACDMEPILALVRARGWWLVEDAAHALGGAYRGRPLGTFGDLAAFSFHETKNASCGEGGALAVGRRALLARAEILREKGTDRSRFFRGEVDKYGWQELGSSYLLAEVLAAVLSAQLAAFAAIQERRRAVWLRYAQALAGWAREQGIALPQPPPWAQPAWHAFWMVFPDLAARSAFISHMRARGIIAPFHYQALHVSPLGQRLGGRRGQCPVAERLSDCLVRLPLFAGISETQVQLVIDAALAFRA